MCTMLEDAEIKAECESHKDYEVCVIESRAKMTSYLASNWREAINPYPSRLLKCKLSYLRSIYQPLMKMF